MRGVQGGHCRGWWTRIVRPHLSECCDHFRCGRPGLSSKGMNRCAAHRSHSRVNLFSFFGSRLYSMSSYWFTNGPPPLIACCIQQRLMRNCSVCRTPLPDSVPPILDVSRPFIRYLWYSEIDSVKARWHVFLTRSHTFYHPQLLKIFINPVEIFPLCTVILNSVVLSSLLLRFVNIRIHKQHLFCPKPVFLQLSI